jgi:hypothetical protein
MTPPFGFALLLQDKIAQVRDKTFQYMEIE